MAEPVDQPVEETIDLVHRAQAGDRAALQSLVERYYERVRRIVRLRLGPALRTRLDSNDILQEVFLQAVRDFASFEMREPASLINWLARMAEHRIGDAWNYHRADKRDAAREVPLAAPEENSQLDRDLSAGGLMPDADASLAEQIARLEAAMERLSQDDRELILLREYAGASWKMVAEETDRPSEDAARMAHAEAVKRLGRHLRG